MTETKLTDVISRLEGVLDELKQQATINATEESDRAEEESGSGKDPKYILLHSGRILGGEKPLSKRILFKTIVANESGKRTLNELNALFPKKDLGSAHNLVADLPFIHSLTPGFHDKYLQTGAVTKDGFEVRALGEWKEWNDTEKTISGNFPVLRKIATEIGYQIIELN